MNMEDEKPQTELCTIIAIDTTSNFSYLVCFVCEKPLSDPTSLCKFCSRNAINSASFRSKRLFRLLMSIASDTRVFRVICFDRAAKVLFGCSADEFFDFAKFHPYAAVNAGKFLEGEMCRMTLAKPKNGNAQHLRVASVVPLSSGFQPVIQSLKELYGDSIRS
ncbi:RNA-directed RNA polymerase catalytic subunit [Bienertia sinuspersici]